MTLKGKKNHYNIKLLRGYGVAIHLKDNRVILKNGLDVLSGKSEKEEWLVTVSFSSSCTLLACCYIRCM